MTPLIATCPHCRKQTLTPEQYEAMTPEQYDQLTIEEHAHYAPPWVRSGDATFRPVMTVENVLLTRTDRGWSPESDCEIEFVYEDDTDNEGWQVLFHGYGHSDEVCTNGHWDRQAGNCFRSLELAVKIYNDEWIN